MEFRRQLTEVESDQSSGREQFYESAKKHIGSLNAKIREKVVIDRALNDKIVNVLQGKACAEKNSNSFVRWCRKSFTLRLIGGHQLLCDMKNCKPVLLYEDMYDVFQTSHLQTAHGGRDKCQDNISVNFSWSNRPLLQIFISQCNACQTRKSVKIKTVTKPIIALGIVLNQSSFHHYGPTMMIICLRK